MWLGVIVCIGFVCGVCVLGVRVCAHVGVCVSARVYCVCGVCVMCMVCMVVCVRVCVCSEPGPARVAPAPADER